MNQSEILEQSGTPALTSNHLGQKWLKRLRIWGPDLAALLFFGVVSFILLWPLSGHLATSTPNEGDALEQIWVMGWGSHALTNDPANLFNGNIFYPYQNTLAYADHLLAQTLQALPVYLLTGNLVLGYGLLTLLSFVLSGWGTYLLVKDITGKRGAGLFAGMVFAFGSYKIGHLSQLNLLSTQWIPFCFLCLRRMLVRDGPGRFSEQIRQGWLAVAGLAIFFALNGLSSFYYFFYIMPLLALYLVIFYAWRRQWPRPAFLVKLAVAGLVAGLLILPTLFPYAAVVADQQAERTPRDVERFSANYRFYIGAIWNNLMWGKSLSRYAGTGGERALFPGALAYLLALVGTIGPLAFWLKAKFSRQKPLKAPADAGATVGIHQPETTKQGERRERWTWLIIGLFALLMSFGWTLHLKGLDIPNIYRLFYNYFPGWVAMRAAVRYGVFVLFAVAILGGLGVAWLYRFQPRNLANRKLTFGNFRIPVVKASGGLLLALLIFGAFWEYRSDVPYTNPAVLSNPPEVYRWLAQPENAGVVVELPAPPDPANPPSIRSYYSTFNWQPYVNGIAAYIPPVEQDIASLTNEFPSPQSLAAFQGLGVRWLIYHLDDENTPLSSADWQKIEAKLAKTPQVKLVKDFPRDHIKVYELAANPWIKQAYVGLPAGAPVAVSDYRRSQPTLIELFQTMLRRDGHPLYGADRAGYRFLNSPPAGTPVAAGLFAADEDPTPYGFSRDEATWSGYGLTFYRRKEKVAAAYDVARDQKLSAAHEVKSSLEISVEKDKLLFNGKEYGSGVTLDGEGRLNLLLGSFNPASLTVNGTSIQLPGGLNLWRSEKLTPGQKIRLEPQAGQTFYLDRAELVGYQASRTAGLSPVSEAVLLQGQTTQENATFKSNFTVWAPPVSDKDPGSYVLTLDIYRRPWGTHPSGHFGTFSIALNGTAQARTFEFNFDPVGRKATAKVNGANVDVGAEVFKAAGDGDWTAYITIHRSNPANPKDFPLVGLNRIYDFSLDGASVSNVNIVQESGKQSVLLPQMPDSGNTKK
ncbi:MAG TPA: hypothetical protein VH186_20740 [Chloroflexia bacterium]|nr:hypothetical protein [Chloroflexia bacterium]